SRQLWCDNPEPEVQDMILFAEQKPTVRKQKKLAKSELEKICAEGYAVPGFNTWANKPGTFCKKEIGTCEYQSIEDDRIVSYGVIINGKRCYYPLCMFAPDYHQSKGAKK
ncbi:MAG: hypothetical protein NTY99_00490, partial [DPANN group archaeon]|nr:hypothetical protein [DPANN group archaeon]